MSSFNYSTVSFTLSSILIRVATIGYGRPPDFEVKAPGQPSMRERIDWALRHEEKFIEAYEEEDDYKAKKSGFMREFMKKAPRLQVKRRKIRARL